MLRVRSRQRAAGVALLITGGRLPDPRSFARLPGHAALQQSTRESNDRLAIVPTRFPSGDRRCCCLPLRACGGDGRTNPVDIADITLEPQTVAHASGGSDPPAHRHRAGRQWRPGGGRGDQWTSSDPEVVTVTATGLLTAQAPGAPDVSAAVGTVSATATVAVNSVAILEEFDGNGQTASSGQEVPTPPAVRVLDAENNPVAGVRVRFQAASGSGSITGELQTTDASGVARVGSWRVGNAGVNHLTAGVEAAVVDERAGRVPRHHGSRRRLRHHRPLPRRYTSDQLLAFAEAGTAGSASSSAT